MKLLLWKTLWNKKNLIEREFLASENIENNVIFRFLPNHFFFFNLKYLPRNIQDPIQNINLKSEFNMI